MRDQILKVILTTGLLVGCGAYSPGQVLNDPHPSVVGGGNLALKKRQLEHVDLALLIDPDGKARVGRDWDSLNATDQITLSMQAFNESVTDPDERKRRRNEIQDRLMHESERLCGEFKKIMYDTHSYVNLGLGSLATAAGVLGSIFTNAEAVRVFSGASGILSGWQAEYNQTRFQNLATQVVIDGIDARRTELRDAIDSQAQPLSIEQYSLAGAIRDVTIYHNQCHIITGLQVAQDSIRLVENPGLEQAALAMEKVAVLRALEDASSERNIDRVIEIVNKSRKHKLLTFGSQAKDLKPSIIAAQYQPATQEEKETELTKALLKKYEDEIGVLAANTKLIPNDTNNNDGTPNAKSVKNDVLGLQKELKVKADSLMIADANTKDAIKDVQDKVFDDLATLGKASKDDRESAQLKYNSSAALAALVSQEVKSHGLKVRAAITESRAKFDKAIAAAGSDKDNIRVAVNQLKMDLSTAVNALKGIEALK